MQQKCTAVDFRITADPDNDFASVELPLGMRQLAGGNCTVKDQVTICAGFLDAFSGEGEGRCRSENHAVGVKAHSGGSGHVVEFSGFELEIVGSVRGANVIIVGTAV